MGENYNNSRISLLADSNVNSHFEFNHICINNFFQEEIHPKLIEGTFDMQNITKDELLIAMEAKFEGIEKYWQSRNIFSNTNSELKTINESIIKDSLYSLIYSNILRVFKQPKNITGDFSIACKLLPKESIKINFRKYVYDYDKDTSYWNIGRQLSLRRGEKFYEILHSYPNFRIYDRKLGYSINLYCLNLTNPSKSFMIVRSSFPFYFELQDLHDFLTIKNIR